MEKQIGPRNIIALLGSPRKKGNSAILAQQIIKGTESAGAHVESFYLHGMQIAPCQSCYKCQRPKADGCVIDDDMQSIYPKLRDADTWVIASPVFWFNMSAQTKLFMDRCFAFPAYSKRPAAGLPVDYHPQGFAGKRIGIA
jgi:multimeric flavodoxin WrbA